METRNDALRRIGDTLDILGESPVWCALTHRLYWVDIRAPALRRFNPATGEIRSWPMPDLCAAVILSTDHRLLLSMRTGLFAFDPVAETMQPMFAPEPASLGNRLNESKCDREGRLWIGTMRDYGLATTGALYRIDRELSCKRMLHDITVPNATCWSPDNRTMYFADTPDGRVRAYEFDAETGSLGPMRVLNGAGLPGRPDGATVDAAGGVWNARYDGSCVVRFAPDGRVDRTIEVPASRVTSCALGGAELRRLYITTARQKLSPAELAAQPAAGALFAVEVDVAGLPEPRFKLPS
ncbi:MAG: SMP-30/gluconolactonase/LRE family protein [Burkholderiales bacterium]